MASSTVLKPLPSTREDFLTELETLNSQNLDELSEPPKRVKLLHNVLSSAEIKRPFQSAMILLLGISGAGKSSTLNHLLDTGDGVPFAATSSTESETKNTTEYVLTFDDPSFEVSDLKMRVVDTPGFNDDAGVNQDACNFVSIKDFFQTHPSRRLDESIFPNLVFLVVSAMDTRIKGPNSKFVQCLRGIKLLEVVDGSHPNIVVVLTFCCSVPRADVKNWEATMQEKKDVISTVVFEVLGVMPPVVLLENEYDGHGLTKVGDFTLLPDGEKQPKNLYNACQELLEQNKDRCGLMVFNASFSKPMKDRAKKDHEVVAKNSSVEILSDEEIKFSNYLSKDAKGGLELDPIAKPAMEYIGENKLDKTQQEEISKIVKTMKSLGLSDEARLQSVTLGEIYAVHGEEISEHGISMLEKKFRIKRECSALNSDIAEYIGQGYDIIMDMPVSGQIMKFSNVVDTKFGFRLPSCVQIISINETQYFKSDFETEEDYMVSRLQNLGLNVDLAQNISGLAAKSGVNTKWKKDGRNKSTKTIKSSVQEFRIARLNIGSFETKEISFTKDFVSAVKELPEECTDRKKNRRKFQNFFNQFGHYVVTSVYVGGAVETENRGAGLKHDIDIDGSASASVSGLIEGEVSGKMKPSTAFSDEMENTRWNGGQSDLHHETTLQCEEKMQMWKASLSKKPTLLKNEMKVVPISSVVGAISKTKGAICEEALHNLFQGKDLRPVCNRQKENEKMENYHKERRRIESNSRYESIKPPDSDGWQKYFPGSGFYTVIAVALSAVLVYLRLK